MALAPLTTGLPLPANFTSSVIAATMTNNPSPTLPPSPPAPIPTNVELSTIDADNKKQTGPEAHTIQPWIIAAVVLACLAVLGACLAIFWVMRHSRKRKLVYGEKGHLGM